MTCREKLAMEHPEDIGESYIGGCNGCPCDYGYLDKFNNDCPMWCSDEKCKNCWDREIPDTPPITPGIVPTSTIIPTDTSLELINTANEMIQSMKKMTDAMDRLTVAAKELYMKIEIEKGKLEHV